MPSLAASAEVLKYIWLLSALIGSVIPRFRNQIFVFDMGESVKINDLAKRMIELAGLQLGKDIDIEYTGLRPGEKLYEEVLSNAENTIPTEHERIRIAKVREYKSKNSRFEIFDKQ